MFFQFKTVASSVIKERRVNSQAIQAIEFDHVEHPFIYIKGVAEPEMQIFNSDDPDSGEGLYVLMKAHGHKFIEVQKGSMRLAVNEDTVDQMYSSEKDSSMVVIQFNDNREMIVRGPMSTIKAHDCKASGYKPYIHG